MERIRPVFGEIMKVGDLVKWRGHLGVIIQEHMKNGKMHQRTMFRVYWFAGNPRLSWCGAWKLQAVKKCP